MRQSQSFRWMHSKDERVFSVSSLAEASLCSRSIYSALVERFLFGSQPTRKSGSLDLELEKVPCYFYLSLIWLEAKFEI